MSNDDIIVVHMPSLVAVLLNAERRKGSPLTEEEVLEIRDSSEAMAMPRSAVSNLVESRGYEDIDPENAWIEWQEARQALNQDSI